VLLRRWVLGVSQSSLGVLPGLQPDPDALLDIRRHVGGEMRYLLIQKDPIQKDPKQAEEKNEQHNGNQLMLYVPLPGEHTASSMDITVREMRQVWKHDDWWRKSNWIVLKSKRLSCVAGALQYRGSYRQKEKPALSLLGGSKP
jgi:hypothetical protein